MSMCLSEPVLNADHQNRFLSMCSSEPILTVGLVIRTDSCRSVHQNRFLECRFVHQNRFRDPNTRRRRRVVVGDARAPAAESGFGRPPVSAHFRLQRPLYALLAHQEEVQSRRHQPHDRLDANQCERNMDRCERLMTSLPRDDVVAGRLSAGTKRMPEQLFSFVAIVVHICSNFTPTTST